MFSHKESNIYWENRIGSGKTTQNISATKENREREVAEKCLILQNILKDIHYRDGLIVDAGCGDGLVLSSIQNLQHLGFDFSKSAVERCAQKNLNVQWVESLEFSSYPKVAFLTYCMEVLYHITESKRWEKAVMHLYHSSQYFLFTDCIYEDKRISNHICTHQLKEYVDLMGDPLKIYESKEYPFKHYVLYERR